MPVTYEDLASPLRYLTIDMRKQRLEERQVDKVNGHWIWKGTKHKGNSKNGYGAYAETGYGVTGISIEGKTVSVLAHVYSYLLFKGPILEGYVVDQLCNLKLCINPDCLEAKTQGENVNRHYAEKFGYANVESEI